MKDLAVYRNGFQKSFKHMPDIQKKLKQENRFFATFRSYLTRAKQYPRGSVSFDRNSKYAIYLGAELIVQEFIKDIFSLLADRFECGVKDESARKTIFLEPLDEDEANGLVGLDFGTVETLLRGQPNVSLAKAAARHMNSHFTQYKTGLWRDKLMGLFLWDDNPTVSNDDKKRGWENMPFRRLARSLYSLVRREYDDATARRFLVALRTVASQKIWIIPQYDIDKISGLRKSSPKIDLDTGKTIDSLSDLERTNWLMPQLPQTHFEVIKSVERDLDLEICGGSAFKKLMSALSNPLISLLTDNSHKTRTKGLPKYLSSYGWDMALYKARDFWAELENSGQFSE